MIHRRQLLRAAIAFPAVIASRGISSAAQYDLVIRGGRIVDPSQRIDRLADVAVRAGKIAAIKPDIPASDAAQSIDALGKLVVPGLIDIHVHARDAELPPSYNLASGVTSMVDGGSRGADNIGDMITIAKAAPNRLRMLLNIARWGNNNPDNRGEFLDGIAPADVPKALAAAKENRQWVVGIKARLSRGIAGDLDLEVLRRARQVADKLKIPIMIHMGDTASPLPDILELMRPGDIVTHLYAPPPHGIMDDNMRILPQVWAARRRGVLFDFGNGRTEHWTWDIAKVALEQRFAPDTISTDLSLPGKTDQVFDLPTVMSKFLVLGMPVNEIIASVTSRAARSIKEFRPYGSLRVGATADITILELAQGNFEFVDNYKTTRMGSQKFVTKAVVFGGKQVV